MTRHTLVTFLGRPQRLTEGGYRVATYRFPDGVKRTSAFFGLTLAEHLEPDELVIFGTRGSMWGVLVESLAGEDDVEMDDARLELLQAEEREEVTGEMLEGMASAMARAIGRNVKPQLIEFGKDAGEQYGILQAVSDAVPNGAVSFDLTHGFRHLGMVGFVSAFMLERVGDLDVRGLWYGALDMTDPETRLTPVLRLDGLSRVHRWVNALNRFDANGDYGVFAPLLIDDGVPEDKAQCLERAAFFERTLNLPDAARQIGTFLSALGERPLPGASGLFQKRLSDRIAWAKYADLAEHQRRLAFEYLKRNDFIRAALFGWEALVTRECSRRGESDSSDFDARRRALEALDAEISDGHHSKEWRNAFSMLRNVRNTLAHGNPPNKRFRELLMNAERLKQELGKAFRILMSEGGET